MSTRVILADDHEIVLERLRALLQRQRGIQLVGEARDGREAVDLVAETKPDMAILDVSMPGLNGVEATRRIHAANPEVKVICLSMHADGEFVTGALQAGATGYVLKECALDELVTAVRCVVAGQSYISPSVAGAVVRRLKEAQSGGPSSSLTLLTPREREVLQLIAEGHNTRYISERLHLSVKTIATHRDHMSKKLDIHSVAGLTKFAVRHGLTELGRDSST